MHIPPLELPCILYVRRKLLQEEVNDDFFIQEFEELFRKIR